MSVIKPTHTPGTLELKNLGATGLSSTVLNGGVSDLVTSEAALNLAGVHSLNATLNKSVSAPGMQMAAAN